MAKKLYVGNLEHTVTEEELRTLFSEHGEILSLDIVKDRYSGTPRGFGFVEFANDEDAQKAKQALNEQELKGRALRVEDARERREGRGPRNRGSRSRY
jgi:RNA recognition motif-containing protein